MSQPLGCVVPASRALVLDQEHELEARVRAEFGEMPGLRLTLAQASRLFSLSPVTCERILTSLVRAGYLATDGRAFVVAGRGRADFNL
jgi:hypothetical protein